MVDVKAQGAFAVQMLRALMISGPFLGIIFVNNNAFQGMGRGLASLMLSLSRQGLVFLPVLLIADAVVGLNGLIYAQPIADLVSVVIALSMMAFIQKKEMRKLPVPNNN